MKQATQTILRTIFVVMYHKCKFNKNAEIKRNEMRDSYAIARNKRNERRRRRKIAFAQTLENQLSCCKIISMTIVLCCFSSFGRFHFIDRKSGLLPPQTFGYNHSYNNTHSLCPVIQKALELQNRFASIFINRWLLLLL